MEFKQAKAKLIISDKELSILAQTLEILDKLMEDMEDKDFSLIETDNFNIDFEFLDSTMSVLNALINSNKLEVE